MSTTRQIIHKISFEIVDPRQHPQYYCEAHGEHPCTDPADVAEEHWRAVEREGEPDSVLSQYQGLTELIAKGELIRNPKIWRASAPEWAEIRP